eukprot:15462025-Alexandrium_andersonii.AAC.1
MMHMVRFVSRDEAFLTRAKRHPRQALLRGIAAWHAPCNEQRAYENGREDACLNCQLEGLDVRSIRGGAHGHERSSRAEGRPRVSAQGTLATRAVC